jgi:hypothetical protein
MPANIGGKPKAVKAESDQFEPSAARDQSAEFGAIARKGHFG